MSWTMAEPCKRLRMETRGLEQIRLEREELSEVGQGAVCGEPSKERADQTRLRRYAVRMEIEEGRRLQAASDDRFLARRRWTGCAGDDARQAEDERPPNNCNVGFGL